MKKSIGFTLMAAVIVLSTGAFAQAENSNFHFHQTLCTAFSLRGAVLQSPFTDWYAGRGIAQGFALDQQTG